MSPLPLGIPSGKLSHNYGKSLFLMGKSTISMAIFNSFLLVYQRVLTFHLGDLNLLRGSAGILPMDKPPGTEAMVVSEGRILLKRGGYVTTNELILSLKMWNPP